MINTPKKPGKKGKNIGDPPSLDDTPGSGENLAKPEPSDLVPMNFKVDAEFRKSYRTMAAMHDVTMTDILKESFELYRKQKGG